MTEDLKRDAVVPKWPGGEAASTWILPVVQAPPGGQDLALATPALRMEIILGCKDHRVSRRNQGVRNSFLRSQPRVSHQSPPGSNLRPPSLWPLPARPVWQLCLAHTVPGSYRGLAPGLDYATSTPGQPSLAGWRLHGIRGAFPRPQQGEEALPLFLTSSASTNPPYPMPSMGSES